MTEKNILISDFLGIGEIAFPLSAYSLEADFIEPRGAS
jgi:hypothetical protein